MGIYANHAATAPALSDAVKEEICAYIDGAHLNAGRNFEGLGEQAIALRARRAIAGLLGADDPLSVVFTSGATASLNMAIRGLVEPGDHVLATSVEHNAAARPLEALRKSGAIDLEWLGCEPDGTLSVEKVRRAIRGNTRLLVMTHASNVLGTILPVAECFEAARERGAFTVLDMAQTAGVLPWSIGEHCDLVAFAGHKGLGALAGVGGLVVGERVRDRMRPWIAGGTGGSSRALDMPDHLPDKFEPGTQNTVGILSLAASVEEITRLGVENIRAHERACMARFMAGLRGMRNVAPCGTMDPDRSVAVVSLVVKGCDSGEVSSLLFERRGIITRSGLHCSPLAHRTAGTFPAGSVRFSFGRGTTEGDIDIMLEALAGL